MSVSNSNTLWCIVNNPDNTAIQLRQGPNRSSNISRFAANNKQTVKITHVGEYCYIAGEGFIHTKYLSPVFPYETARFNRALAAC